MDSHHQQRTYQSDQRRCLRCRAIERGAYVSRSQVAQSPFVSFHSRWARHPRLTCEIRWTMENFSNDFYAIVIISRAFIATNESNPRQSQLSMVYYKSVCWKTSQFSLVYHVTSIIFSNVIWTKQETAERNPSLKNTITSLLACKSVKKTWGDDVETESETTPESAGLLFILGIFARSFMCFTWC